MALNLSIIKSPAGVSLAAGEKTFSEQGGTIGRGDSNDWVLSDPDRFLSSKHCSLSFEGGQFYLTDTSTNGTFVNGSPEPLGKGGRVLLNTGDVVEMGDYQFRVDLGSVMSSPSLEAQEIDPFGSSPFDSDPDPVPVSTPSIPEADPFASDPFSAEADFSLNPDPVQMDPLAALDGAGKVASSPNPIPDTFGADPLATPAFNDPQASGEDYFSSAGSHSDGADALNQAVDWPDSKNENIIPDDWDDDFLGGGSSPRPKEPSPAPQRPRADARPTAPPAQDPQPVVRPEHMSIPLTDPPKASRPRPPHQEESLLSERKPERVDAFSPAKQAPQRRQEPVPTPPPVSKQRQDSQVSSSLLDGLNLSERDLSPDEVDAIHQAVGELMPVIVAGMMQVLRARASIKNEFRMNVTTIQPIENNPLKFSANATEAIENMFTRKSGAYMGPAQAFQEGFDGIGEHQVAIIAGIRAAFKSMMDRFDPSLLEKQFEKQGKSGVIPGMQKTKYWNSYVEYYQGFVDNMENTFQYLFGDEFVHAYEEQLRRLAMERKKKQKTD